MNAGAALLAKEDTDYVEKLEIHHLGNYWQSQKAIVDAQSWL